MPQVEAVQRATGRSRVEWFEVLDTWGAPGRPYKEIAAWLTGEHDISRWWAQKLIVEYEQERGLRAPGIRRDGTFEVSASKTIAAPADRVFAAFADGRRRKRWLADQTMSLKASAASSSARFELQDGSRVNVSVVGKGRSKSTVVVAHDRLTDAKRAQATKTMWRQRLVDLKSYLEERG